MKESITRSDDDAPREGYIIYDGECGFCRSSIGRLEKIGYPTWIEPLSFQEAGELLGRWGLSAEDTNRAMYLLVEAVDQRGEPQQGSQHAYRGAAGISFLLRQHPSNPFWRLLGCFYLIPGIKHVQDFVYWLVARNRHRLGCGSDACTLPTAKSDR